MGKFDMDFERGESESMPQVTVRDPESCNWLNLALDLEDGSLRSGYESGIDGRNV